MPKEKSLMMDAVVVEAVRNAFIVQMTDTGVKASCTLSGRLRKNFIKVVPGDIVAVELSPYDLTKGRIVSRER